MPSKNRQTYNEILTEASKWPQLRIMGWKAFRSLVKNKADTYLNIVRQMARHSHCYYLSDDLVWAITRLSVEVDLRTLIENWIEVRMPFDQVLFEWNPEARNQAYTDLGQRLAYAAGSEERPATHVLTDGTRKYNVDLNYDEKNKNLVIFPVSGGFNNVTTDYIGSPVLDRAGTMRWMFTDPILNNEMQKDEAGVTTLTEDSRFAAMLAGPLSIALIQESVRNGKVSHEAITSTAGSTRWLMALGLLMNQPNVVRYVNRIPPPNEPPSAAVKRPAGSPREMTLFLPKEKVVSLTIRHLKRAERKPAGAHEVAGHWAYSHRSCDPNCLHDWPTQHSRRQVCQKCGGLRWFRANFQRGKGPLGNRRTRYVDFQGSDLTKLEEQIKNAARDKSESPQGTKPDSG